MLLNLDANQPLYIIGTGIYADELCQMIRSENCVDTSCIAPEDFLRLLPNSQCMLGFKNMEYRKKFLSNKISQHTWPNFVHESAVVIDKNFAWCRGTVVGPFSMLGYGARLKEFCDIGPMCLVGHGTSLGPNCVASNSVRIGGSTLVGANVFFGQSSSIKTKIQIVDDCIVGMGSIVNKNLSRAGTYVGSPVRKQA